MNIFLGCCFLEMESHQLAQEVIDKYDGFKPDGVFEFRFNWVNNKTYFGTKYTVNIYIYLLYFILIRFL